MKNKGFTLIEVTAVVLILGVIFLISFPTLHNILKKSEENQADVDNKNIIMAAKTYINLHKDDFDFSEGANQIVYLKDLVTEELIEDNNYSDTMAVICDILNAKQVCKVDDYKIATEVLLSKVNDASITTYTDGNTHEMYTFSHDATTQTEALIDYRYIGSDPYNYVTFNNELWRIIGVFTVEDENGNKEQRIKIIRNELIGSYAWDSNNVNEWSTASLQTYLNGDYYNSLSDEAKSMIGETKYYLGGISSSSGQSGPTYYAFERGTTVYSGRSTNWIGKIGLMYPSDYAYTYANGVDNKCYTDTYNCKTSNTDSIPSSGWLYNGYNEWLISPFFDYSFFAFILYSPGFVGNRGDRNVAFVFDIRPSTYLISSIQLDKGTGTIDDPYTLKVSEN